MSSTRFFNALALKMLSQEGSVHHTHRAQYSIAFGALMPSAEAQSTGIHGQHSVFSKLKCAFAKMGVTWTIYSACRVLAFMEFSTFLYGLK